MQGNAAHLSTVRYLLRACTDKQAGTQTGRQAYKSEINGWKSYLQWQTDDEDIAHLLWAIGLQLDVVDGQDVVEHQAVVPNVIIQRLHPDQVRAHLSISCHTWWRERERDREGWWDELILYLCEKEVISLKGLSTHSESAHSPVVSCWRVL